MKLAFFKYYFPIVLLFQSLGLGVTDVIAISDLLEHAKEHRLEEGDSFFEFLKEHYFTDKTHNHEGENPHQKLPFHQSASPNLYADFIDIKMGYDIPLTCEQIRSRPIAFYRPLHSTSINQKILQPPKT